MILAQRGAVVEHRVHQDLRPQWNALVVAALRDRGGKSATGTGPHDGDAVRVDAELVGVRTHPSQRGHAIVERGGERMFGCQPVIRRDRDDAEIPCESPGSERLELRRAHDITTAVYPEHARP